MFGLVLSQLVAAGANNSKLGPGSLNFAYSTTVRTDGAAVIITVIIDRILLFLLATKTALSSVLLPLDWVPIHVSLRSNLPGIALLLSKIQHRETANILGPVSFNVRRVVGQRRVLVFHVKRVLTTDLQDTRARHRLRLEHVVVRDGRLLIPELIVDVFWWQR